MTGNSELSDQTVLITGASGVLGQHFARTFARAGARVAACSRSMDRLNALVDSIGAEGGRSMAFEMDVTDLGSISHAVAAAEQQLGPVRVLVNNSGISKRSDAVHVAAADYDDIMATNARGTFFVAQQVGRRMIECGKGGSIINISSVAAIRAMETLAVYCMSKAAISHLTRVLAVEWARFDIRVNAIEPGWLWTPANQALFDTDDGKTYLQRFLRHRVGAAHHLDAVVMMLATSAGDFMTGQSVVVDDGYSLVL
jgi:NAD(P)-dependent dehydrogenase (short-subunit alcohol dehydrogenase family)